MTLSRILLIQWVALGCADRQAGYDVASTTKYAVADLEIGDIEGGDPFVFGAVSGITTDGSGLIYVADHQADEVRAFRADGSFAHLVAGRGSGPGEVQRPCCLMLDDDGLLWVRDTGNARYNGYEVGTAGASHRATVRMNHASPGYWVAPSFDAQGNFVDVGDVRGVITRFHLGSDGAVRATDEIPGPPADSLGQYTVEREVRGFRAVAYIHQPHGPRHLVAHAPNGEWAEAVSSRYAISWHRPEGIDTIVRNFEAPVLSAREAVEADSTLAAELRRWNVRPGELSIDIPSHKPPLADLTFSREGRLWVFLNVSEGMLQRVDIFDRNGNHRGTINVPADLGLRYGFVSDTVALGVRRDDLGVQYVVRLKFRDVPSDQ